MNRNGSAEGVELVGHDPLCPFAEWPEESCYQRDAGVSICALIARVRADERAKRASEDQWISAREAREREADIRADERDTAILNVYVNCAHTKYLGCAPCVHDEIANAIRTDAHQQALKHLPEVMEWMGGYARAHGSEETRPDTGTDAGSEHGGHARANVEGSIPRRGDVHGLGDRQ